MISTFAGTFISSDRENDTSRSALTNRPRLTYTHMTKGGGCKMEDGKDKENGEKGIKIQTGDGL